MSGHTRLLLDICEKLPESRQAEVADFAQFLLLREQSGGADADEAWERTLGDPNPRPRLDSFVQSALAEGSEPLDPDTF